jgi:hypothetical protein
MSLGHFVSDGTSERVGAVSLLGEALNCMPRLMRPGYSPPRLRFAPGDPAPTLSACCRALVTYETGA